MNHHQNDASVVSFPPRLGSIKNAWSAISSPIREIWSPLVYHVLKVGRTANRTDGFSRLTSKPQVMKDELIELVSHLILCLIMTILLPISLPWKLIMKGRFTLSWKWLLAVSCFAISLDPLFFYIPFIDENKKCLGKDRKLRAIALALRSVTDLVFLLHIIAQIHDKIDVSVTEDSYAVKCTLKRKKWYKDIIIVFIGILPIPQVTIIIAFFRMRGFGYQYKSAIGNVVLLLQFIARVCQIYHFQRQLRMSRQWSTSVFYFLTYILAGNVLGAFWYFLSIQREISCWNYACKNSKGSIATECVATNYCGDPSPLANITLLNEFCHIGLSNETSYDFGVFLRALQSGNTGSISFWTKYFYTFWWGIKNLSNFGTNLDTSNDVWENCFTIFVSLVGLLLFIYLLGTVQTYMLSESTRALEDQREKVNAKYQDLDMWLSRNDIQSALRKNVVDTIKQNKVVERNCSGGVDVAVDLVFVFNALKEHDDFQKFVLLLHFCQKAIEKVTVLQYLLRENHHKTLLDVLDPVIYEKDSYVVEEGKPNDKMLIITDGVITCTDKARSDAATASMIPNSKSRFEKGELYGQELLSTDLNNLTGSTRDVKCETKVEALALTADKFKGIVKDLESLNMNAWRDRSKDLAEIANKAYKELTTTTLEKMNQKEKDIMEWLSRNDVPKDLQTAVIKHIEVNHHALKKNLDAEVDVKYLFSIGLSWDIEYDIKKHLCMSTLYKVPVLKLVNEDVLHRICMYLEPVILPKKSFIVLPNRVLDRMFIIVGGEIMEGEVEGRITKGNFYGEDLLTWAFPGVSSKAGPAVSTTHVECCTKVEAFALTKECVESVVAYYRDGTNKFEKLESGRDHGVADTKSASTSTISR